MALSRDHVFGVHIIVLSSVAVAADLTFSEWAGRERCALIIKMLLFDDEADIHRSTI